MRSLDNFKDITKEIKKDADNTIQLFTTIKKNKLVQSKIICNYISDISEYLIILNKIKKLPDNINSKVVIGDKVKILPFLKKFQKALVIHTTVDKAYIYDGDIIRGFYNHEIEIIRKASKNTKKNAQKYFNISERANYANYTLLPFLNKVKLKVYNHNPLFYPSLIPGDIITYNNCKFTVRKVGFREVTLHLYGHNSWSSSIFEYLLCNNKWIHFDANIKIIKKSVQLKSKGVREFYSWYDDCKDLYEETLEIIDKNEYRVILDDKQICKI